MSTSSSSGMNTSHRERLQQAVRVMDGLSDRQRAKSFDINLCANELDQLCEDSSASAYLEMFLGIGDSQTPSRYRLSRPFTVGDAIAVLTRALDELPDEASAEIDGPYCELSPHNCHSHKQYGVCITCGSCEGLDMPDA